MTESIQQRLLRVRPPRVRITYDVETGGAMEKLELPFIVGILADLQGDRDPSDDTPGLSLAQRPVLGIDRDSFDDVMRKIGAGVQVDLSMPGLEALKAKSLPADSFINFSGLDDFSPLNLVMAMPTLRGWYLARNQIRWVQTKAESSGPFTDKLESWLKFDPVNDLEATPAIRAALPKLFSGAVLPGPDIEKLHADLIALFDIMQAYNVLPNPPLGDDQKAAFKTAQDAALTALQGWGLDPDPANPDPAAAAGQVLRWGNILLTALTLPPTPENQLIAHGLVKLLTEQGVPDTTIPADIARNTLRAKTVATLGYSDPATAQAAAISLAAGLSARTDVERDAALAKALFLCGLHMPSAATDVLPVGAAASDTAIRSYQNAGIAADARGQFMSVLSQFHDGSADAATMARELFSIIEMLRPSKMVPAMTIVNRLYYFVQQIVLPWLSGDEDLLQVKQRGIGAVIDAKVVLLEKDLSAALSSIIHMESFRKLEASWRGLHYLVSNSETNGMLMLKVLSASKAELRKDMETAVEFDQSALFKRIYEAEFGTFGGFPYSLLVGDYEISADGEDVDFISKIAEIAAAAHAPFIAAAAPALFGMESFGEMAKPRELAKIFESTEMELWKEFREMEDARYVTLVLPHVLLRLPYGNADKRNTTACEGLNFEESLTSDGSATVFSDDSPPMPMSYPTPDTANFLWGNAAYVLAERITNAYSLYSWTAAIRGAEGGGLVENLPLYSYASDSGSVELFCPTEVTITDRREKELSDLGFLSLCHCKGTSSAAFFGGQTTNNPKTYFSPDANANARLSALLPYMLAASRFAHYIKVIMRKKVGSFLTRANVESYLNNWIAHYVLLDDNAPQEAKAAFPLREASVVVSDVPGEPGRYTATAFLKPHFQLEELSTSIRLVATLPGG